MTPVPQALAESLLGLPEPGTMVNLSPAYAPMLIKGLTVDKNNPFKFDFIMDQGQEKFITGPALKNEGERLIKYFLASLAIPENDLWVNLSPYEKSRTIPRALGQTDLGRDMLAQDYILKQITASLIYPERQLGKDFWDRVYARAQQMFGTTQIPVNTFNKVWIKAQKAEIFEHNQTAFVVGCHLQVMLEEDYLALTKNQPSRQPGDMFKSELMRTCPKAGCQAGKPMNLKAPQGNHPNALPPMRSISSQVVRQIILPELEHEVNTGQNFAPLRQIFNSIILAAWYKKRLKGALLNQVFSNRELIKGLDLKDPGIKDKIYEGYLKAYKKGVFNFIKEDSNDSGEIIPRKYFSGGIDSHIDFAMSGYSSLTRDIGSSRTLKLFRVLVSPFRRKKRSQIAIAVKQLVMNAPKGPRSRQGWRKMAVAVDQFQRAVDPAMLGTLNSDFRGAVETLPIGYLNVKKKFPKMEPLEGPEDVRVRIPANQLHPFRDWFDSGADRETFHQAIMREAQEEIVDEGILPEMPKALEDEHLRPVIRVVGEDLIRDSTIVESPLTGEEPEQVIANIRSNPKLYAVVLPDKFLEEMRGRNISIKLDKSTGFVPRDYWGRTFKLKGNIVEINRKFRSAALNGQFNHLDRLRLKYAVFFDMSLQYHRSDYHVFELDPELGVIKLFGGGIQFKSHAMTSKGNGTPADAGMIYDGHGELSKREARLKKMKAASWESVVRYQRADVSFGERFQQFKNVIEEHKIRSRLISWRWLRFFIDSDSQVKKFLSPEQRQWAAEKLVQNLPRFYINWIRNRQHQERRIILDLILEELRKRTMSSSNLSNPAMFVQARDTKGGIDLNADQMRMDTRVQGEGVEMKVDQAMIERIRHEDFEGLNFSIQSISPITNLPLLLGLSNPIPEVLN